MAERRVNRLSNSEISAPCGNKNTNNPCSCRTAVTRTYFEMLINVASPAEAMDAALRVYSYHHPGYGRANAVQLIEHWLAPNALN